MHDADIRCGVHRLPQQTERDCAAHGLHARAIEGAGMVTQEIYPTDADYDVHNIIVLLVYVRACITTPMCSVRRRR